MNVTEPDGVEGAVVKVVGMTGRIIISILLLLPSLLWGQSALTPEDPPQQRRCGHYEYIEMLTEQDPEFPARRAALEEEMNRWIMENAEIINSESSSVITIPVVVHILYFNHIQNIPHSRVIEQIDRLNKDFRRLNSNLSGIPAAFAHLVADVEFEFCLARRDPQGNWTNGVTRRQVSQPSFTYHDDHIIKSTSQGGQSIWNPARYLNIWVVNLTGGVLGYAQPPGGNATTDGIVIGYRFFGSTGASPPFNHGRTTVHEVGHWFNLIHIWGDDNGACWGSDLVHDTPNQASEFYGCPTFPQMDICTPDSPGVMFMNYMDYVNDDCMMMFTHGQKARMLAALNVFRPGLKNSNGCKPAINVEEIPDLSSLSVFPNPGNGLFRFELIMNTDAEIHLTVVNSLGQTVWDDNLGVRQSVYETIDLQHLAPGFYYLSVSAGGSRTTQKLIIQ